MQGIAAIRNVASAIGGGFLALFNVALYVALGGFSLMFVLHEFGVPALRPLWLNFVVGIFVAPITTALSILALIAEGLMWIVHHV